MKWKVIIIISALAYIIIAGIVVFKSGINQMPEQSARETEIKIKKDTYETVIIVQPPAELKPRLSASLPIDEISPSGSFTVSEILNKASEGHATVCENEEAYIRDACMERYYYSMAEAKRDPSICKQATKKGFIDSCMANSAITAVALAYYTESEMGTKEVIPSNIALCDMLEVPEDRALCMDPALAIEKNYNQLAYKIK